MMSVDDTLMCSFQILKPADKKAAGGAAANTGSRYQMSPGVAVAPLNYSGGASGGAAPPGSAAGGAGSAGAAGGNGSGRPSTPPKVPGAKTATGGKKQ